MPDLQHLRAAATLLPDGLLHPDVAVAWDDTGTIHAIIPGEQAPSGTPRTDAVLVPGLVNVHCHLELSHLWGKIPAGIGMVPFVQAVQRLRNLATTDDAAAAIRQAVQQAAATGTVAIGDIANGTIATKALQDAPQVPSVVVRTFLELFGGASAQASERMQAALQLLPTLPPGASITPHAPYSVSEALLQLMAAHDRSARWSIHLMESKAEMALFASHSGPFADFFQQIGLPFEATAQHPWDHLAAHLTPKGPHHGPLLLVHLTEATGHDLDQIRAQRLVQDVYMALCPRSNLFLHHTFPPVHLLDVEADRICIGTDSLASNWSLDMVRELHVLQQHRPDWTTAQLLTAATATGADALGLPHLGRLKVGAAPGLVLLHNLTQDGMLQTTSVAERLVKRRFSPSAIC